MPQYRYQARHATGRIHGGMLSADNASAAATMLRNQGHHVLRLVPLGDRGAGQWSSVLEALNWSSGPSSRDVLDFTTQLAVMIRAGISLRQALEGIADQTTNVKFRKMLLTIKTDVESGQPFSAAISRMSAPTAKQVAAMAPPDEPSTSASSQLPKVCCTYCATPTW